MDITVAKTIQLEVPVAPLATDDLLAFVRTVESGSLSRAARELGIPRATLGRRLASLETRLGARLIRRTTRRIVVTDAGTELYPHARAVLSAAELAEAAVRRADGVVGGVLRVSAPPDPDRAFAGMFLAFSNLYPQVVLEIDFTTHHVDLVASGYDLAIRAGPVLDPGLVARRIGHTELVAVASPAYLARRGTPLRPADLVDHDCLLGFSRGSHPMTHWPLCDGGQVRVRGVISTNDIRFGAVAAEAGRGIAVLPRAVVDPALAAGSLVHVLQGVVGARADISLVYPERELMPAAVRKLIDFVVEWSRDYLEIRPPTA